MFNNPNSNMNTIHDERCFFIIIEGENFGQCENRDEFNRFDLFSKL